MQAASTAISSPASAPMPLPPRNCIAEIARRSCALALGIPGRLRHAEHIGTWLRLLKKDRRAIFTAASLAQQASDYLLGQGRQSEVHEQEVHESLTASRRDGP